MPNQFGTTKRHIRRAALLCEHIEQHLEPVHDGYVDEHPDFAELVLTAARFTRELHIYLDKVYENFVAL